PGSDPGPSAEPTGRSTLPCPRRPPLCLPGPQPTCDVNKRGFHHDVVALVEFDRGGAFHAGADTSHVSRIHSDLLAVGIGEHDEFGMHLHSFDGPLGTPWARFLRRG